jgi:hypothetical protein
MKRSHARLARAARACVELVRPRDLRHAVRTLRRSRGLVLVATLSLGFGIGVNTTLYSVFRTVMLQPPTAPAPDRLVRIEPGNSNQISHLNFGDLRPAGAFEGIAAYATTRLNLRSGDEVEPVASSRPATAPARRRSRS